MRSKNINKDKMGKKELIIKTVLFVVLIIGFIYLGTTNYTSELKDNERFSNEFPIVSSDNVFNYIGASRVYNILKKEDGIILFGFKENEWTGYYANVLNDTAKELGIDNIYYYDFYSDRKSDNSTYLKIVEFLSQELLTNDLGEQDITAPSLVMVHNQKIIAYDSETSFITGVINPEDYWSDFQKNLKKSTFRTMLTNYINSTKVIVEEGE